MGERAAHGSAENRRSRFGRSAVVAIFYALHVAPAAAQEQLGPFSVLAGVSVMHDSNLFRLAPGQDPNVVLGEPTGADTVTTYYAGLRLDKSYALQRVQLEVRTSQNHYDRFSYLDYRALDYRASWRYAVTPHLRGTLSADRTESLVPYSDFQGRQRNVRVSENQLANADYAFSPAMQVQLGITHSRQSSEVQVLAEADTELTQVEAGLRYAAASGSGASLLLRRGDGAYINRPVALPGADNSFKQYDTELQVTWVMTSRSQLRGRAVWFSREHDNFSQQDDSGYTGQGTFAWDPTARLHLDLVGTAGRAPFYDGTGGYRTQTSLSVVPLWQVFAKVAVRARLYEERTQYHGVPARTERLRNGGLGLEWSAIRNASLGARIERETRSSSDPAFNFSTTITSFNLSLAF